MRKVAGALAAAVGALCVVVPACGGDSGGATDVAETGGDHGADADADTPPEADGAPDAADVGADTAGDGGGETADTAGDGTADGAPDAADAWAVTINVEADGTTTPVDLSTLDRTTFDGHDALRLTRVIEVLSLSMPWNYHYDFIGNDGFDPLPVHLGGDLGKLPCYGELDQGFLYWDAGTLRIGWDPALGFPGSLGVQAMDGGTIRLTPIAVTTVVVAAGAARTLLDLTTFTTVDITDYLRPDDGAMPSIPFGDLLAAAGVTAPDTFAYKMWGNDGFANNDDNLMPWANAQHSWLRVDTRRIVMDEAWDTTACCWRVRDTILIKGFPAP